MEYAHTMLTMYIHAVPQNFTNFHSTAHTHPGTATARY